MATSPCRGPPWRLKCGMIVGVEDATVWTLIATAVAAAASLTAIVVGVDQLTRAARDRRLEALLRGALEAEVDGERQRVIADLHRLTVGRFVAREAVPLKLMVVPAGMMALGVSSAFSSGLRSTTLWGIAGAGFLGSTGVIHLVRLAAERHRVARCYREAIVPIRAYTDTLARMEGGSRLELLYAHLLGFSVVFLAGGAGLLAAREAATWLSTVLMVQGLILTPALLLWFKSRRERASLHEPRNRDGSLSPTWTSPSDAS